MRVCVDGWMAGRVADWWVHKGAMVESKGGDEAVMAFDTQLKYIPLRQTHAFSCPKQELSVLVVGGS